MFCITCCPPIALQVSLLLQLPSLAAINLHGNPCCDDLGPQMRHDLHHLSRRDLLDLLETQKLQQHRSMEGAQAPGLELLQPESGDVGTATTDLDPQPPKLEYQASNLQVNTVRRDQALGC